MSRSVFRSCGLSPSGCGIVAAIAIFSNSLHVLSAPPGVPTREIIVNNAGNQNVRDEVLTLQESLLVANRTLSVESLTAAEAKQVKGSHIEGTAQRISFAIPGAGPHEILVPVGGFAAITASRLHIDGYSQAGSSRNTGGLHESNNAILKIVLDARNGNHTGQPGAKDGDILSITGSEIIIEGLSVLSTFRTAEGGQNFGINFRQQSCIGGRVSGCWIGLHPDGVTVGGGEIGLGADSTGGNHIFGTDGDGVGDRGEFNLILGHNVNTIVERAARVRISGNFIGVMPNGLSTIPASAQSAVGEGDAIEGADADDLIVGTNGDGVGDADEGNVIGGIKDDVVEIFAGANPGIVLAGNTIGVGIDGNTPLLPMNKGVTAGPMQCRFGSNFDGKSDDLESNTVANLAGYCLRYGSPQTLIAVRGNRMFNNAAPLFAESAISFHSSLVTPPGTTQPELFGSTNRRRLQGRVPVAGPGEIGLLPTVIDLYLADPETATENPQGSQYLASFTVDDDSDVNGDPGVFEFDISALSLPETGEPQVTISAYVVNEDGFGNSEFSNAADVSNGPPKLRIALHGDQLVISWSGAGFTLQTTQEIDPPTWNSLPGASPFLIQPNGPQGFFRLIQ